MMVISVGSRQHKGTAISWRVLLIFIISLNCLLIMDWRKKLKPFLAEIQCSNRVVGIEVWNSYDKEVDTIF